MANQPETISSPRKSPRPRKKTVGLVLRFAGVLVVLLVVVVILLPTILSLGVVRGAVVSNVNGAIPGSIEITGLRVGWMRDASVRGLVLRDAAGDQVLSVDAIDADGGSILDLLKTRGKVMALRVTGVEADVIVDEAGRMNLLEALAASEPGAAAPAPGATSAPTTDPVPTGSKAAGKTGSSPSATPLSLPPDLALMLDLQAIDISVTTPQSPAPVRLLLEDAVFDARNLQDILVKSKGTMTAGAVASEAGNLLIEARITDLIDSAGVVDPVGADIQSDLVIDNAPLALLALAGQDVGQIQTLVGAQAATVSGHIGGHASDLVATFSVTAGEAFGATLAASFDGQVISLKQPAILRWALSPKALASVSQLVVDEAVVLEASIDTFTIPLVSSMPDLSNAAMTGAIFFDAMRMQVEGLGKVVLANARLDIDTTKLGDAATVSIKGEPSINDKPGSLAMTAKVLTPLDQKNMKIQVEGGLTDTPAAAIADGVLSLDGLLTALLGPSQSITLAATASPDPSASKGADTSEASGGWLGEAKISGDGQGWSLELAAGLNEQMVDLSELSASIQLTQGLVDKLNERQWLGEVPLSLKQPVRVEASLRGGMPVSGAFEMATLAGSVGVDRVWVSGIESLENTSLRDIKLVLGEGRLDQKKSVSLDAVVQQFAKRGSIKASATGVVFDTNGKPKLDETSVAIQDVPVGLIERLANQPGQLKPWLGEVVNSLQLALKPESGGRSQAVFSVNTPLLKGGGNALIHQTPEFFRVQTDQNQPITLTANISDASLRTLRRQAAEDSPLHRVTIEGNAVAQVRVPSLSIEKLAEDDGLNALNGQAQITINNLAIRDENGERVDLERLTVSAVAPGLTEGIQIEVVGKRRGVETPMLAIKGVATGLIPVGGADDAGDTSAESVESVPGFSGTVTGHRLPMGLADTLAGSDQLLPRLFGQAVDVSWRGAWPGKADVNVTSNAIQLATQAHTDAYEKITLPEGLSLKFDLLNLGDNALLGELHPVFDMLRQTSVVLLDPIELALDKNTVLPIADASLQVLALTGGLNLGRIKMETGDDLVNLLVDYATQHQSAISNEDLQSTLALVNQGLVLAGEDPIRFGGALSDPGKGKKFKNSNATMTKIPFTLKDGVFDTGQSWIDSRDVQVGFQGRTDLNTGEVDYKLGIPGKTLIGLSDDLFGKVLDSDHVYEFNLDGNAVNGFNTAADGFDTFLRSGLIQELQAKLTEGGGLDLTKFGVKKEDSDVIGGLLGGLLGGRSAKPEQPAQSPQPSQTPGQTTGPGNTIPWTIPTDSRN